MTKLSNSYDKELEVRKRICTAKNFSTEELQEFVEKKKEDLGFFINDLAALLILAKDWGVSVSYQDGSKIGSESPIEKVRSAIQEKHHLSNEQFDQLLIETRKLNIYFQNDYLLHQYLGRMLGVKVEEPNPLETQVTILSTKELEALTDKGMGHVKGIVVRQRVQMNKQKQRTTIYKTTILDETGFLELTSYNAEQKFSAFFLEVGKCYVFFSVSKADPAEGSKFGPTYWWHGSYEESKQYPQNVVIDSIDKAKSCESYDYSVIRGLITEHALLPEWLGYDPFDEKLYKQRGSKYPQAQQPRTDGETVHWYQIERFMLSDRNGSLVCRSELCNFSESVCQRAGIPDYNNGINHWEVTLFGRYVKGQYADYFVVAGVLQAISSTERDRETGELILNIFEKLTQQTLDFPLPEAPESSTQDSIEEPKAHVDPEDNEDDVLEEAEPKLPEEVENIIIATYLSHDKFDNQIMPVPRFTEWIIDTTNLPTDKVSIFDYIGILEKAGLCKFRGATIYPT